MQCPLCKEEIMDGARKCKHCGSMLEDATSLSPPKSSGIGYAVTSLITGLLAFSDIYRIAANQNLILEIIGYKPIGADEWEGLIICTAFSTLMGVVGIVKEGANRTTKGLATAGIAFSALAILIAIGLSTK